jgi:hypothetical protein
VEMPTERQWVHSFVARLDGDLEGIRGTRVRATDSTRLAYACEIQKYSADGTPEIETTRYETDILIADFYKDESWVPRVVIECKLTNITSHDALTYSAKAATHRAVHPYLRYGFLAGNRKDYAIPPRLIRHGENFDFMLTWSGLKASPSEWRAFVALIKNEVKASRKLQTLLQENRSKGRRKFKQIHRSLRTN